MVRLERAGRVAWMTDLHHPHKRAAGRKRRVLQLSVCLWCAFLGSVPRLPRRGAGVPRVCVRLRLPLHVAIRLPSLHFASRAATSCLPSVSLLPFADASIEAAVFQMDGIKVGLPMQDWVKKHTTHARTHTHSLNQSINQHARTHTHSLTQSINQSINQPHTHKHITQQQSSKSNNKRKKEKKKGGPTMICADGETHTFTAFHLHE